MRKQLTPEQIAKLNLEVSDDEMLSWHIADGSYLNAVAAKRLIRDNWKLREALARQQSELDKLHRQIETERRLRDIEESNKIDVIQQLEAAESELDRLRAELDEANRAVLGWRDAAEILGLEPDALNVWRNARAEAAEQENQSLWQKSQDVTSQRDQWQKLHDERNNEWIRVPTYHLPDMKLPVYSPQEVGLWMKTLRQAQIDSDHRIVTLEVALERIAKWDFNIRGGCIADAVNVDTTALSSTAPAAGAAVARIERAAVAKALLDAVTEERKRYIHIQGLARPELALLDRIQARADTMLQAAKETQADAT